MVTTVNDGAWDWTRLMDENASAKAQAWRHLLQTPWMGRMFPLQHRLEVLMSGVAGWGPGATQWSTPQLAWSFHEALGVSFQSPDPQHYMDAMLYGLTMAWGAEVTSFNLSQEAAAVSFAVCDVVSKEPVKSERKYTKPTSGARTTPKKAPAVDSGCSMALDGAVDGAPATERGGASEGGGDDKVQEHSYREPSFRNARWMRKRPGAPRWTQKLCRFLERLMEAEDTENTTEVEDIIHDVWRILLDCDKSGKDALKAKVKDHKKKEKQKERRRRKKEKRRAKKANKSAKSGKSRRRGSGSDSSSSSSGSSSDSESDSSSFDASSSSGRSSKSKANKGSQRTVNMPEFKYIDGKRHFQSKKTGDWVNCESQPKSACPDCGGHHWWFDKGKVGCKGRQK